MRFYLGVHHAHWLTQIPSPLFLSRRTLARRRTLPRAVSSWALDSGGFSELSLHGKWMVSSTQYAGEVRRFSEEIGGLQWAAIMDWACEPRLLKKTGLSIRVHQQRTIASYLDLRSHAPSFPWTPVLQGWSHEDYLRHVDDYDRAGVNLVQLHRVGVGTIYCRQNIAGVEMLVRRLASLGLRLHAFGLKTPALLQTADVLVSSDSMAWSATARKHRIVLLGHENRHQCCNNCSEYALLWRDQLLGKIRERRSSVQHHTMAFGRRDAPQSCLESCEGW
jgi:hypothetical protein